jgi:hypothetical protein
MKKFLIINNGDSYFRSEIIQPFLENSTTLNFTVDIQNDNIPKIFELLKEKSSEYQYLIFNNKIGSSSVKTYELIKYLKDNNKEIKTALYLNEFWNTNDCHIDINIIRKSDMVISYSPNIINEIKRIKLNDHPILFENFQMNSRTKIVCNEKKPVIGIVPRRSHIIESDNILLLEDIHKHVKTPDFFKTIQLVLVGFDPRGTIDDDTIVIRPELTYWALYERIITNDYKICSPEYKDFLLKFLPNSKYDGDIENEPYKRIWYNEVQSNIINYNILLKPLVKNKYNTISYDYEIERAKCCVTPNGKPVQVIRTDKLPKSKKAIMRAIIQSACEYRQPCFKEFQFYIFHLNRFKDTILEPLLEIENLK